MQVRILLHTITLFALSVMVLKQDGHASESWACTEGVATLRKGDSIFACGIGLGGSEPEARLRALDYAKAEFDRVCGMSSDCRGREVSLTPGRNTCEQLGETQVRCYRGLTFELSNNRVSSSENLEAEMDILNERIRLREQELEAARLAFEKRQRLKELDRKIAAVNRDEEQGADGSSTFVTEHTQWFNVGGEFATQGLPWDLPQVESPVIFSLFLELRPFSWIGVRGSVGGFDNGYEVSDFYYDYGANVSGTTYSIGVPLYYPISRKEGARFILMPEFGSMNWAFLYNTGESANSGYYSSSYDLATVSGTQDFFAFSLGFESRPGTGLGYAFRAGLQKYEDYYDLKGETRGFLGLSVFFSF